MEIKLSQGKFYNQLNESKICEALILRRLFVTLQV